MKKTQREALELRNLCFSCEAGEYFNINLDAYRGEVHGISMSGVPVKSPFYDLFKGKVLLRSGSVYIGGTAAGAKAVKKLLSQNIYVIGYDSSLISSLTLAENLYLVDHRQPLFRPLEKSDLYTKAESVFRKFEVEKILDPHEYPDRLTPAQKHIVELMRAYVQKPWAIYMENITLIYSQEEMELWGKVVKDLAKRGEFAVLLALNTEQELKPDILDRVTVMRSRTTVMELSERPFRVSQPLPVMRAGPYLEKKEGPRRKLLFSVSHLAGGYRIKDLSFSLLAGETAGIFNPSVFDGQELMDILLSKIPDLSAGVIPYGGNMLFYNCSLFQNVVLRLPDSIRRAGFRSRKRVTKFLYDNVMKAIHGRDLLERYGDSRRLPEGKVTKEQSVRIQTARWLFYGVKLLIFVSPESHYDTQNFYKFGLLLEDIREQGVTVLIFSENLEFLRKCCERIIEVRDGILKELT